MTFIISVVCRNLDCLQEFWRLDWITVYRYTLSIKYAGKYKKERIATYLFELVGVVVETLRKIQRTQDNRSTD